MKFIDAGKAVRELQKTNGISNAELARKAATSPQQVIRWRNQVNMKLHTMQVICAAVGAEVEEFWHLGK